MTLDSILTIVFSGALATLIPVIAATLQRRKELKAAAPKEAAEAESIGRTADGQTIDRLGKENVRLSDDNDELRGLVAQMRIELDMLKGKVGALEAEQSQLRRQTAAYLNEHGVPAPEWLGNPSL